MAAAAALAALAFVGACGVARAQVRASAPAPASAPATSPSAVAGGYRLDPAHTFVTFEVRHFWTSTLRGRLGPLQGEVTLDPAAGSGDVRLRIPMATLSTGFAPLDARLRRPDLLAVDDWPEAYFIATRFRYDAAGGVQEVRGEFILRGHSEPLSLYADRFACREDALLERRVCGGDFHGDLRRGAFGANFGEPFVGDEVHLVVQVEAIAD